MFSKIVRLFVALSFILSCVACTEGNNPYAGIGDEKSAICETYPANHPAYAGNCK